eukprot:CAMPEP_0113686090 /NCGR_PEP_ID=MMETSP0038_2-20120614/15082_1 /TAXON_ID=2898 /ORGANISM="Cryptomonas paramecium" /LENGTH=80 /DNA_ID=CAMNT_0000606345 /DNA_START=49 /DNA_END=288 /DNA_ORIENTATION=- /assembly_acc=CAM_ASM_000170
MKTSKFLLVSHKRPRIGVAFGSATLMAVCGGSSSLDTSSPCMLSLMGAAAEAACAMEAACGFGQAMVDGAAAARWAAENG